MGNVVTLIIDEKVLEQMDKEILKNKYSNLKKPKSRGKYIEAALDYYWKVNCGLPYILKGGK